jgi:hypothetical protein
VLRAKKRPPLLAAKSREETPKEGTAEDKKLYTDFSFLIVHCSIVKTIFLYILFISFYSNSSQLNTGKKTSFNCHILRINNGAMQKCHRDVQTERRWWGVKITRPTINFPWLLKNARPVF